jgi:hypothetical protein
MTLGGGWRMEKGTVIGVGVIICDIDVLGLVSWRERGKDRETRTETDRQREREKKGQVKRMTRRQATSYHHIA